MVCVVWMVWFVCVVLVIGLGDLGGLGGLVMDQVHYQESIKLAYVVSHRVSRK